MKLSQIGLCFLCACSGCGQESPHREAGTPASAPAGISASGPAQALTGHPGIDGFVAFCERQGVAVRLDPEHAGSFLVSTPSARGVELEGGFRVFAPGTSAADMQAALRGDQLGYPYLSEDAGLAMWAEVRTLAEVVDVDDPGSGLMAQLLQLLRDYRPPRPAGPPRHPATAQEAAHAMPGRSTAAFADYCRGRGLNLVLANGDSGYYSIPPTSTNDFELMVCFLTFPPGTKVAKMDEATPDSMEFPFDNESAGLSMCEPGARGKGPMPVGAYKRASEEIAELVRLFGEYRPTDKPAGTARPADTQPERPASSGK